MNKYTKEEMKAIIEALKEENENDYEVKKEFEYSPEKFSEFLKYVYNDEENDKIIRK